MIPKKIKKIHLNDVDENGYDMQNREYIDLSQVWHDASEEPQEDGWILVQFSTDVYDTLALPRDIDVWHDFIKMRNFVRWAYVSDMLPKHVK